MLEGIVVAGFLVGGLVLLYYYNRPSEDVDNPTSPLADKVPAQAVREKSYTPASYSAPPVHIAPPMDMTVLLVAATLDTNEPERYSSPTPSYASPSYDDSSSRNSGSSWGGDCGSSYSSSDSSSSSSDSCSY